MPTLSPAALKAIATLDAACHQLAAYRRRPLLVMYYPPGGIMTELDVRDTYEELRVGGGTKESPLTKVDLLLHTSGGDPVAGYRIARTIRSLCLQMDVLVPEYAYSAGTLTSFSGDEIRMGDYAGLSPIDITVREPGSAKEEGVQLAGVDSFLDFARGARREMEKILQSLDRQTSCSTVDSDLLVQMVKEVGALTVGKYYRERRLTGDYAQALLQNYMFKQESDRQSRAQTVVTHFLFGAPSHDFHVDYYLCKEWHLRITEMPTGESDLAKGVVRQLRICTDTDLICPRLTARIRMPFIRFYASKSRRRTPNARGKQKVSRRTRNPQATS